MHPWCSWLTRRPAAQTVAALLVLSIGFTVLQTLPAYAGAEETWAGMMAGAAAGMWISNRVRAFARQERPRGMINWERTREIAVGMNKGEALTAVERSRLDAYYGELVARCIPIVDHRGSAFGDGSSRNGNPCVVKPEPMISTPSSRS